MNIEQFLKEQGQNKANLQIPNSGGQEEQDAPYFLTESRPMYQKDQNLKNQFSHILKQYQSMVKNRKTSPSPKFFNANSSN